MNGKLIRRGAGQKGTAGKQTMRSGTIQSGIKETDSENPQLETANDRLNPRLQRPCPPIPFCAPKAIAVSGEAQFEKEKDRDPANGSFGFFDQRKDRSCNQRGIASHFQRAGESQQPPSPWALRGDPAKPASRAGAKSLPSAPIGRRSEKQWRRAPPGRSRPRASAPARQKRRSRPPARRHPHEGGGAPRHQLRKLSNRIRRRKPRRCFCHSRCHRSARFGGPLGEHDPWSWFIRRPAIDGKRQREDDTGTGPSDLQDFHLQRLATPVGGLRMKGVSRPERLLAGAGAGRANRGMWLSA